MSGEEWLADAEKRALALGVPFMTWSSVSHRTKQEIKEFLVDAAWMAEAEVTASQFQVTKSEWRVVSQRPRPQIEAFLQAITTPSSGGASSSTAARWAH